MSFLAIEVTKIATVVQAVVDPSLKKTSQKLEASYAARAPSKTDIFTQGKEGEVISFDCWIRSSVTVPNL